MRTERNERKKLDLGSRSGFTLVEIMLVVVIIGILASVAVVATKGKTKRAAIMATKQTIEATGTAIDNFEVDCGVFPASIQDLVTDPGFTGWQGPYMRGGRVPSDAWGNALNYTKSEEGYKISSSGPDGQAGSGDDLTN